MYALADGKLGTAAEKIAELTLELRDTRNRLTKECTHHMRTVADRDRLHCEVAELRRALDSQNV